MQYSNFEAYLRGYGRAGGEWLEEDSGLRLYVRHSVHCSGGYDIANLDLPTAQRGQGIFREFILIYSYLPLRLENVLHPGLRAWCERNHHIWIPDVFSGETYPMSYVNTNFRAGVNVKALKSRIRVKLPETAEG